MQDQALVWLPIAISLIALGVSAVFGWTSQLDRRSSARLAREKDLHVWVRGIADAYVSLSIGEQPERMRALERLAVEIDYGRLLFPNETSARAKNEYPTGRRSSVLDPLVETCRRCDGGNWTKSQILKDWREFTDQLTLRTTAFAINTSPEAMGTTQYRNP